MSHDGGMNKGLSGFFFRMMLRVVVGLSVVNGVGWAGEAVALFDGKTLANWKGTEFGGRGDVLVEGGEIRLAMGNDLTGINFVGVMPKMDYELRLEASRVEGSDFFCGLTFLYGEASCTLVVGGWGGGLVGLSSINGEDASENETTTFRKFEKGKWYRIRVRVTAAKIEAWIDGDLVVDVVTKDKKIGMRAGEIELSKPFGIATFRTSGALRKIFLEKLGNP